MTFKLIKVHVVPKKGAFTVIRNDRNELIPTRTVTGWRVCIDYRKLNTAIRKDHFPLPFIDQMLDRLAGHHHFCFLDGYSGYNQIAIAPEDQEKTTFICPYGTFAFKRMSFCEGPPPGPLRRRVPPITVGPHPGSQYLAPALALGSPVLAPQGHPTSGYLVKSPLTISFASVRVRSCELRRYNHPRHTLTTN